MEKRRRTGSNNFDVPRPRLVRLGASQDTKGNKKEAADTGGYSFTFPQPYQPEFATPERVQWPVDRHQMNRYARLFHKTDSTISTVLDLQADIIATNFELTGGGMDSNEIRTVYEDMIRETQITSLFRYFITEFLIMGEVVPHCVLDKDKKRWTHVICHNPDQINVIDSPFLAIDPVVEFVPDASLKKLIKSKHPTVQKIISTLPGDMLGAINKGRGIPLDTTLNTTFIPRKLHPYDIRGTSILTKLIRVLMYEDAIVNACFQEDTPILMDSYQYKPIQAIKVGDKVIDKDGHIQVVTNAWKSKTPETLTEIKLVSKRGLFKDIRLVSTDNHKYPVFRKDKIEKIEAKDIRIGDYLISPRNLNMFSDIEMKDDNYVYIPIKSVKVIENKDKIPVYNLTVDGDHSYVVDGGIGTYNSISTARRHAGPLKLAFLGEKDVGGKGPWIPDTEYQDELIRLLTVAEQDPHAFLVLPWFVRFEAFGTTDRMMSIRNEWDVIERMKLTALGVSQGFIHGESTFASMTGTLQTMLMRFRALRTFFEDVWWYPKFFQPIAEMNEFIKRPQSEVKHKLRFRKSKREIIEGNLLLMPKIQWSRSLDPNIDTNLLDVYDKLVNRLELPISKTTAYSAVGLNFEEQVRQSLNEKKKEEEIAREVGVVPEKSISSEEKTVNDNVPVGLEEGVETPPSVEEVEKMEGIPVEDKTEEGVEPTRIIHRRRRGSKEKFPFTQEELDDLAEFMETGKTASELWSLVKLKKKSNSSATVEWEDIEDFLNAEGYKQADINQLQYQLIHHRTKAYSEIEKDVSKLHENMSDEEFVKATDKIIDKHSDMFFVGAGNSRHVKN